MSAMADEPVERPAEETEEPTDEAAEIRRREMLERLGRLAAYTTPVMLATMSTSRPAHASE